MSPLVANVMVCLFNVVTILLQSTRTDAVGKEASVNKAHAPGSSWKGKESCPNNGDMFHLNDKNSVHSSHTKVLCNVTELDKVSKQQCGDKGFAITCRGGLTSISHIRGPDLHLNDSVRFCKLDLNNNLIKRLRGREFITANVTQIKVLCLSNNCISIIDSTAFDGLTQLMFLNLSMNMLTWPTSFGQGVFAPLGNLITLNLKANNFTTYDRLDTEMVHLKNLTNLFLDAHNGFGFNESFKQLTHLTQLSISGNMEQDSNMPHCNVTFVTNDTFVNIPNLKWLYMSYCHITRIDKEAFSPLSQLEVLDISYNENLHFKGMNDAMYGLRNSTTFKELNVNQINSLYEEGIKVKAKHLENLVNITSLLEDIWTLIK